MNRQHLLGGSAGSFLFFFFFFLGYFNILSIICTSIWCVALSSISPALWLVRDLGEVLGSAVSSPITTQF